MRTRSPRRGRAALTLTAVAAAVGATVLPLLPGAAPAVHAAAGPVYLDPSYTPAERAADLTSRMTLAEKASEMNSSQAAAIPRLGVAAWGWWNEAAHGVACQQTSNNTNCTATTNTTSYPVALSAGSTWDPALINTEGAAVSDEAREVQPANSEDLDFYAPTINLGRDPRWGRNDETWSEDPYLTATMASQYVDGLQGQDSTGAPLANGAGYLKAGTTIKHYALNNSENNRLNGNSVTDDRSLREYYTEQFRSVIAQAHPTSMMSSYNEVNGTPSAADTFLNTELARETFGFDGYFTSDCDAIYEEQAGHQWVPPGQTVPVNAETRHAWALGAGGEDLDCNEGYNDGKSYANELPSAVTDKIATTAGTLNENDLDVSLVRLFTIRMQLGEFDAETAVPWVQQARARLSTEAAATGASATWTNSDANDAETETPARLALDRTVADKSLVLLKNAVPAGASSPLLPLKVPTSGPYTVLVYGPDANPAPTTMFLGGYSSAQSAHGALNEVTPCAGITSAIQAVNAAAVVQCLPGTDKTTSTPNAAQIQAAASANLVIAYATTDASTSMEAQDRANLTLPWGEDSMISQLEAAAPGKVVVDLETVGTVDVTGFAATSPAILWSSYNGMRKGQALADVLTGAVNPSGHLPFTWYAKNADLPATTDYTLRADNGESGRTYMYYKGADAPSFPFGFGLSYTTFGVSNVAVSSPTSDPNGSVTVTADVTNTGTTAGTGIFQLYAAQPNAPAALERPASRLEGFRNVTLAPGATQHVSYPVSVRDLAYFDATAQKYTVDQGLYRFRVGQTVADTTGGTADTTVAGTYVPTLSTVTMRPAMPTDPATGVTERVQFPVGSTITPLLTADLSDDTLAGYITRGASTALPAGMTVSYASDRPDVVRANGSTVTAVGGGVATITALVTYQGHSQSVSEPILVNAAAAASLPEAPAAALLPVLGFVAVGGAVALQRRRRRTPRV